MYLHGCDEAVLVNPGFSNRLLSPPKHHMGRHSSRIICVFDPRLGHSGTMAAISFAKKQSGLTLISGRHKARCDAHYVAPYSAKPHITVYTLLINNSRVFDKKTIFNKYLLKEKGTYGSDSDQKRRRKRNLRRLSRWCICITMIVFLVIIGLVSFYMLKKMGVLDDDKENSGEVTENSTYNTFLRINSKDVLVEMTVLRVAPDAQQIVGYPCFGVHSWQLGPDAQRDLEANALVKVENTVSELLGIEFNN